MKEIRQAGREISGRGGLIGVVLTSLALSTACNGADLTLEEWETR